jgi:hypothetical protein
MRLFIRLLIIAFITVTVACNKSTSSNDGKGLTGKWKLKELYVDPGNGSGQWGPLDRTVYAEFKSDGTFILKDLGFDVYHKYYAKNDSVFVLILKDTQVFRPDSTLVPYTISNGELTMNPIMCIEGCGYRFTRVSSK